MKHLMGVVASLTQGLGLMQKNPVGFLNNVALLHTNHYRFLQLTMSSSTTSTSLFGSSEQDAITQALDLVKDKCHWDIQDTLAKVATLVTTSDPLTMPSAGDSSMMVMATSRTSSTRDVPEVSPADVVVDMNQLYDAVVPVGEMQCTKVQLVEHKVASDKFAKCIGVDFRKQFELNNDREKEIKAKCDAGAVLFNPDNCTDAVMSDEFLGGALRDLYQHPGKYCSCLKALKEDIPACSTTVGNMMDETWVNAPDDFDEVYRDMKVSLGFLKNELCTVGLACDALEDACVEPLNDLATCLSEHPACESGYRPISCDSSFLFSVPPDLSQGRIPDVCLAAYKDHKMKSHVVGDYSRYVQMCHPEVTAAAVVGKESTTNSMSKQASWVDTVFVIGIVAVAVTLAVALVQMRKKEKVAFTLLSADEP